MATLEVHDVRGRIRRFELAHEHPVLFGTSAKCDIVLEGDGIYPFHGRIRWKQTRYKIDASPDSEYLLINGHKMAAASFRQGDVVLIGRCRIVMLYGDDEPSQQDDKTRVQAPPLARRPSRLEEDDWIEDLGTARDSAEIAVAEPRPQRERSARPTALEQPKQPPGSEQPKQPPGHRGIGKLLSAFNRAPGEERLVSSPLVIGLVAMLAVLVVLSVILKGIIDQTTASRLYSRAVENFDDGDYRNALRRFDEFITANPKDGRARKARVLHALANVRQFTTAASPSWTNALEAETAMLDAVGKEEAFRDASTDLAEEVVKTGEALADRARAAADAHALEEAESAAALHARITGASAQTLLARTRLPAKLAEARAAVRKAQIRARGLADMDAALQAKDPAGVYAARGSLVRQYADLAQDRDLIARMTQANELIRLAVKFDPSRRPAETEPRAGPFQPPVSLVLRAANSEKASAPPARLPRVFALADGFAYGLNGRDGAPLWQVPIGLSAPFPPQPVPGGTTVLVGDAHSNEFIRLDSRTGALVWRQEAGEPLGDPPLVLGNQVIQPTRSGKLLLLDLKSGELQGTVNLGLTVTRTPVSDEAGQFFYVLAEEDCLFVLKRDPIECVAVEYLGHRAGSIPCAPARLGRFLIVAENFNLNEGRWRVLLLEEEGARARPLQQVKFPGWLWGIPAASGSVIWGDDDRSGIAAFAVGAYEEKEPIRLIARLNPESRTTGPSFALARSERELWVGSGHPARYELDTEKGTLNRAWTIPDSGPALAPVQVAGPLLVLTQQSTDGPGVTLLGVDPQSGAVRWRSTLGAPWPVAPAEAAGGGLSALGLDGRALTISREQLAAGGFVTVPIPPPGQLRLPPGRLRRLSAEGVTVLVPAADASYLLTRTDEGAFRRVDLPTPLGAEPLIWGRDVLVPGADGRAYLMDPRTGESRAEPLVPAFDRAHPTRWKAPVRLEGDAVALADEAGKVRRVIRENEPRPRLVIAQEVNLGKLISTDPASTGGAIILTTADGRVRSLAARDLSPSGAWALEAPPAFAPAAVGGYAFVVDKSRNVLALGPEGQRLWSVALRDATASGPPVVKDGAAWFLARDGSLQRLALADGAALGRIDLGVLPVGGLGTVGPDLVVPVALGTVRLIDPKGLAEK